MTIRFVAALVALSAALVPAAVASCLPVSASAQRAHAEVILEGVALNGATPTGIQRFRARRYIKGTGPLVVRVKTDNVRRSDGSGSITSVGINARRGETWRIYAKGRPSKVLISTLCSGSQRR